MKFYTTPDFEVEMFDCMDVITASVSTFDPAEVISGDNVIGYNDFGF